MARGQPGAPLELIGTIRMLDSFQVSTWADKSLFFRHIDFEDDLALISDEDRELWIQNLKENKLEPWGDTFIKPLPEDREEAQRIIEIGENRFQCPFAWLLKDIESLAVQ